MSKPKRNPAPARRASKLISAEPTRTSKELATEILCMLPDLRAELAKLAGEAAIGSVGALLPSPANVTRALAEITGCLDVIERDAKEIRAGASEAQS